MNILNTGIQFVHNKQTTRFGLIVKCVDVENVRNGREIGLVGYLAGLTVRHDCNKLYLFFLFKKNCSSVKEGEEKSGRQIIIRNKKVEELCDCDMAEQKLSPNEKPEPSTGAPSSSFSFAVGVSDTFGGDSFFLSFLFSLPFLHHEL